MSGLIYALFGHRKVGRDHMSTERVDTGPASTSDACSSSELIAADKDMTDNASVTSTIPVGNKAQASTSHHEIIVDLTDRLGIEFNVGAIRESIDRYVCSLFEARHGIRSKKIRRKCKLKSSMISTAQSDR
jgi:hypothetical protein